MRFILSVLVLLAVFLVGTAGYVIIEEDKNITWFDAAFMTAITLSTVGYGETWEVSKAGHLWTILVIVFGIAAVSVSFTSLATVFISGELRSQREVKRMECAIEKMSGHVIVCGFGRIGGLVTKELMRRGLTVVVIESRPEAESALREMGIRFLTADATEEEVLLKAGLMKARALVVTVPHDADNVYITLTAHDLRPDIEIIARAEHTSTEPKLRRAGATRVVCPQVAGATMIANILTRPNVVDFVEIAGRGLKLEMDEYVIGPKSPLAGKTLCDSQVRERGGAIVVAIKRADGETIYSPPPEVGLTEGDTLILVGPAGISSELDGILAPA
jgi:voltage-gated potassium channel